MIYWLPLGRLLQNGINLNKAGSGTRNMVKELGKEGKQVRKIVSIAAESLSFISPLRDFVLIGAGLIRNIVQVAFLLLKDIVLSAVKSLWQINIEKYGVAVEHVVADCGTKRVFNLVVEGEHVYYANGILVSNSDALMMTYARAKPISSERERQLSDQEVAQTIKGIYG